MTKQVRIKICGLRTMQDVEAVNQVHPEYCGFIFDPTRERYISPETARDLVGKLEAEIRPVAVFVDAELETILQTIRLCQIHIVQLHGHETNAFIDALREQEELTILQAFHIESPEDVKRALDSHADLILLDHGIGGTGESFDWNLIRDCGRDFVLAGGLGPDNVQKAIQMTHPWAVDVSSSLETDGHKDPDKIRRFVESVRS